jgi:photosystem II stability/assembly factor-like uncharacterized protein
MADLYTHLDTACLKDGWDILGPGGGGCVHTLTVNPHRPDTLVVSCDMTAGYITHNGGKSWREFNLKSRQYAYSFDPFDPDTIYVGTSGLFRSVDNGATWRLLFPDPKKVTGETRLNDEANHSFLSTDNWPGKSIHAILIDPLQPDHLFIVIKKDGPRQPADDFYARKKQGLNLFTSTNRGQTWHKLGEMVEDQDIYLLAIDPTTPVGARALFAFTEKGITWINDQGALMQLSLPPSIITLRHASGGVNPKTGRMVFYISAVVRQAQDRFASTIWKSTDLGETWQQSLTGLQTWSPGDPPAFSQVSTCASDARRAWLIVEKFPELDSSGNRIERYGILRSDDEGLTWEWAVKMDDDHDPDNREFGWAERDYGARWGDIKGEAQISPKGRFAWDVVASPTEPDVCYTMDFSTIYRTRNAGETWEQLVTNLYPDGLVSSRGIDVLSCYGVHFDPFDQDHIIVPLADAGVFHSRNGGRTWKHDLQGVPRTWVNTCYSVIFDPQVRGRAWGAWSALHDVPRIKSFQEKYFEIHEGGVCRTEDGLNTWQPSARGLPKHALCTHIVLDPASPAGARTLYVAVFNNGVYKSSDDGRTWMAKNQGLDPRNPFAWRLALLPDGTLYLVVVKNQVRGSECAGALYRSTDGANTWNALPLPIGVDFPNDLTCDPSGRLYLACWPQTRNDMNSGGGAYASDDGGLTWVPIFDAQAHTFTITVDPGNPNTLYAGTFNTGIYRSDNRGKNWRRLKGYNFMWTYRPVPDPHHAGMLYIATFGSSVWYGPAEGDPDAVEDIIKGD